MTNACPLCGRAGKKFRDFVRNSKPIKVFRCSDCDLDYLEIWNDEETVYKFYDGNNYVFVPKITYEKMKYDEYEGRFSKIHPYLNKFSTVLDIGCGDGRFLKMLKPYVSRADGSEITKYHVENLRKDGFKIYDKLLHEIEPEIRYDIICMFALVEHIPNVLDFLEDLKKRFMHNKTIIFIEIPTLLDPIANFYDVPEYRDFFYREYHLYYFTEKSLRKLFNIAGFNCETTVIQQASITNHFHWIYKGKGQQNTTEMSNVKLNRQLFNETTPMNSRFIDILEKVDDYYRELLVSNGIGDLIFAKINLK